MKKTISLVCVFLVLTAFLGAQENNPALRTILNHYAARNFIAAPINTGDLDTIIQAGIRSPSARNGQPWHFTVVRDPDLAKRIVPDVVNGNVLIVVSTSGDGANSRQVLDCALATQSIYLAAQALGYGSRIYTGPIEALNRNLKADLGLPRGYSAVSLVRIGRIQAPADAVSAASPRSAAAGKVTYK